MFNDQYSTISEQIVERNRVLSQESCLGGTEDIMNDPSVEPYFNDVDNI